MAHAEQKVAPNIYRTPYGWRVYVRRRDPATGQSRKYPVRFKASVTLEELEEFRDGAKLKARTQRRVAREQAAAGAAAIAGTFAQDAQTYLALKTVQAMPSYKDRARDIGLWTKALGRRARRSITTRDVDEQLQQWINDGKAASTVNGRRTALMSLWTRLDGRAAANPVREAQVFQEPDLQARGLPYPLVVRILDAIPAARSYSHKRETKVNPVKTRHRLEVMAWTGIRPAQLKQMTRAMVDLAAREYVLPRSRKGSKRSRTPQPIMRLPLSADGVAAFRQFFAAGCEGPFSTSSARRLFARAVAAVERQLQEELQDPAFRLPTPIRPYDLRHSFGTEVLRATKSLETTKDMLGQTTTRMTRRYALAAMPEVLRAAGAAFELATSGKRRMLKVQAPKAPRPRRQAAS